jgi:GLPGLI family protein
MKKILLLFVCLVFMVKLLFAQNVHFVTSGTVEFNKTVNMYALMQKQINKDNYSYMESSFEAYKKDHPQFKMLKSVLVFSNTKTLFTPLDDNQPASNSFVTPMADQNNIVFNDLGTKQSIIQKKILGDIFLLKDTTRKIHWKITSETREIAGYACRRANAIIMDSIYVVAFYTEKIHVSVGPETFTGLPGMILGLALPHENVTWFASKVTDMTIEDKALTPPRKGKPVTNRTIQTTLEPVLKGRDAYNKQMFLKAVLL